MHIPDFIFGYMPDLIFVIPVGIAIGVAFYVIALIFVLLSFNWARKNLTQSKIAMLAVIAAGIFALQAFNIPTVFGVSGHLVGGALAAIVLGSPFAAVFVISIVLIIQALIFGDGGVLALGANIINMGVIAGYVGFYSFRLLSKKIPTAFSAGIAGWLACVVAAAACACEIALVGAVPLSVGLTAMLVYHVIIGVIEGIITGIIVTLIFKIRPDIAENAEEKGVSLKKFLIIGLIAALVIGGGTVFFASSNPDGLDSTFLINEGKKELFAPATGDDVAGEEKNPVQWNAPMLDYALDEDGTPAGRIIALVIGIIVALAAILAAAFAARKVGQKKEE